MQFASKLHKTMIKRKITIRPYLAIPLCFIFIASAAAQDTAIRAGRLIDPDSGKVLTGQTILIRDNKIEAVGNNVTIPSNAKVIDLSKMTVLPGLIDCHTHLADGAHDSEPMGLQKNRCADGA
jgi:imidazolonepropionase-like amidohydrolase